MASWKHGYVSAVATLRELYIDQTSGRPPRLAHLSARQVLPQLKNLGLGTTWEVLLDDFEQSGTAYWLRHNPMSVHPPTVARFFRRNQCGDENDRHAVQHPVGSELCRNFSPVLLRHDRINKHEVGFETARRFQCAAWIDYCAGDIFAASVEK
jgi:hypothetical protein